MLMYAFKYCHRYKPGDTGRYQTGNILTNCRYWNSVCNANAYPGVDIDSDHNPVVARVKLKKVLLESRKDEGIAMNYR